MALAINALYTPLASSFLISLVFLPPPPPHAINTAFLCAYSTEGRQLLESRLNFAVCFTASGERLAALANLAIRMAS